MVPDAVENLSCGENSNINVWHDDVVEVSELFVLEKRIRHPDAIRVRHRQVLQFP